MAENQIILFKSSDGEVSLPVSVGSESVWLTQAQMAQLFGKDQSVISRHIRRAMAEGELDSTMYAKNAYLVGNASGVRNFDVYNLDVVISVGYRVHSLRGVEFRRWATSVLRDYILRGYAVNRIADHTLVALTVMIAESKPSEKEMMVNLVMNFLA